MSEYSPSNSYLTAYSSSTSIFIAKHDITCMKYLLVQFVSSVQAMFSPSFLLTPSLLSAGEQSGEKKNYLFIIINAV